MRGKVTLSLCLVGALGIIPAHAGKSFCLACGHCSSRDHPRACGEKLVILQANDDFWGSPPRMRGKVNTACYKVGRSGITPAHAGKRVCCSFHHLPIVDHPRACGEKSPPLQSTRMGGGSPPRMRGKGIHSARKFQVLIKFPYLYCGLLTVFYLILNADLPCTAQIIQ